MKISPCHALVGNISRWLTKSDVDRPTRLRVSLSDDIREEEEEEVDEQFRRFRRFVKLSVRHLRVVAGGFRGLCCLQDAGL